MGYKILVVDDEKTVTDVLGERLAREGYGVCIAHDGEEALQKLSAEDPDIILLDLLMPKRNGFEVLQEIRGKYTDRWRPVIIVSAQTDLESVKKSYGLEADHYLTKPCSLEQLLCGIKTMISLIPLRKDF